MAKPRSLHDRLIDLCERFCASEGVALATLSNNIWNDGRVLPRIKAGTGSLTVKSYEHAINWLVTYWPEDAVWPDDVERYPGLSPDDQRKHPRPVRLLRVAA